MRLSELMFKGVFGETSATRLSFSDDFSRPAVPASIPFTGIRSLALALLYPDAADDEELAPVREAREPRVALALRAGGRSFRMVRRSGGDSLKIELRKEGEYRTVAKGVADVSAVLDEKLGRPPVREFRALNLWQFEAAAGEAGGSVDLEEIGPEATQMLEEYEETIEIDEVESRLEEVEAKIEKLRERFGSGFEVEENLEEARRKRSELSVPDLDASDYEMLAEREQRVGQYHEQLEDLAEDERQERGRARKMEPEPPWRDTPMWAGVAVGVAAMAASLWRPELLRWVALVDIAGFGVVAWTFLRYLTDLEQVNIHRVRVQSIKRRMAEVRREMVEFQEKVDHLLVHEGADEPEELLERRRHAESLDDRIERLEEKSAELAGNETFQKAKSRLDDLEAERRELRERREELPEYGADLFQLENQLHGLGIDPEAAIRARRGGERSEGESPFTVLASVARDLDCWGSGGLEAKTRNAWRKMAKHALGGEYGAVELSAEGRLATNTGPVGSDAGAWREEHPDEARALAGTLALAIHLRAGSRNRQIETVLLDDPAEHYPAAIAQRVREVLEGGGRRGHVAVVRRS